MAEEGRLLDGQVKAVTRELSRWRQAARALRRRVKQRQISRKRARTVKHEHQMFVREPEQDIEEFEHALACVEDFHSRHEDGARALVQNPHLVQEDGSRYSPRDLWSDIDFKGWKMIAIYRSRDIAGGRFLAFNIFRREVCLSRYLSHWCFDPYFEAAYPGCGDKYADADIRDTLEQPYGALPRRWAFVASPEEFLVAAQRLIDPPTKSHPLRTADIRYHSLVTLYTTYTFFHSRVVQTLSTRRWPSRVAVCALAAWRPRRWTRRRYKALVRVQALWRGWYFRHRVLYSPHTELGRRYLMRYWCSDLEQYAPG